MRPSVNTHSHSKHLPRPHKPYKQNFNTYFHNTDFLHDCSQAMDPPLASDTFTKYMKTQHIQHITSSATYAKSNRFIGRQVKTSKTVLATAKTAGSSLETLLLKLWSTLIGPHMPSPWEILHNWAQKCPGQPLQPINYEDVCNYLIFKNATQKENHDKAHKAKPLTKVYPVPYILFLSWSEPNTHLHGTFVSPGSMSRSYFPESQDRQYPRTRQHTHALDYITTTPIPRPHFKDTTCNTSPHDKSGP